MKSMVETQYQMRKAEAREALPEIDLLPQIPHAGQQLDMTLFGPNTYRNNISNMLKHYFHSKQLSNITFTPATTAESISTASYGFENFAKPKIFDSNWLQGGWIVRTQEGVFANPPKDAQGNSITDEKVLKQFLKSNRKVNGIYLLDNDLAFAPYDSFTRGVQDCHTFSQGGLARILEHSPEKEAKNLKAIASPKFYKRGVNVWGFDDVKEPILRVVGLGSCWNLVVGRLDVVGGSWCCSNDGCAFGVLNESAKGASQKNK